MFFITEIIAYVLHWSMTICVFFASSTGETALEMFRRPLTNEDTIVHDKLHTFDTLVYTRVIQYIL